MDENRLTDDERERVLEILSQLCAHSDGAVRRRFFQVYNQERALRTPEQVARLDAELLHRVIEKAA